MAETEIIIPNLGFWVPFHPTHGWFFNHRNLAEDLSDLLQVETLWKIHLKRNSLLIYVMNGFELQLFLEGIWSSGEIKESRSLFGPSYNDLVERLAARLRLEVPLPREMVKAACILAKHYGHAWGSLLPYLEDLHQCSLSEIQLFMETLGKTGICVPTVDWSGANPAIVHASLEHGLIWRVEADGSVSFSE